MRLKSIFRYIICAVTMISIVISFVDMRYIAMAATPGIPSISYVAHSQTYGWMQPVKDGNIAGTTGQSKRMEALVISINTNGARAKDGSNLTGSILFATHVQKIGWTNWTRSNVNENINLSNRNNYSGTVGRQLRAEAIRIKLDGKIAQEYDVLYCTHIQGIGWTNWSKNGEISGTTGQARRMEAIKIKLVKKPQIVKAGVRYAGHVQSYGWMSENGSKVGEVNDSTVVGTTGKSKRLEAITIALNTIGVSGSVEYSVHTQSYGWMNPVKDGNIAGTVGQAKRMEAIKINLTGEIVAYYDIYYRAHVQNKGWMDWAKNGAPAGTEGGSLRMEALQIVLVEKGQAAPGSTAKPYEKIKQKEWYDYPGELNIKINKQMNCVTVYKGSTPVKAFICSTGAATPEGVHYINKKWRWQPLMGGVYGQYCSQINGDILFHSVPYNSINIRDLSVYMYNQLGTQASHGCVRLTVRDAKWIYDNCPSGTRVEIYNSADPGPLGKPTAQTLPYNHTWDPTDPAIN